MKFRKRETYLVNGDRFHKAVVTVWIQVIGPNEDTFSTRGYGERAHAGHHVANSFTRLELVDEALMLCTQPAVPENFGIVETEDGGSFSYFDVQVGFPSQDLVVEYAILILGVQSIGFVDHGLDVWVFVHGDLSYQLFEGKVSVTKVEMSYTDQLGPRTLCAMRTYPHVQPG